MKELPCVRPKACFWDVSVMKRPEGVIIAEAMRLLSITPGAPNYKSLTLWGFFIWIAWMKEHPRVRQFAIPEQIGHVSAPQG